MLRSVKEIIGYTMHAKDVEMGKVEDFYFDDQKWCVRYLVAKTGNWLNGRKVLIAPAAFEDKPDWGGKKFPLNLTKEQIKNSPDIDTDKPVSRQQEIDLSVYYNWPFYWRDNPLQAGSPVVTPEVVEVVAKEREKRASQQDPHLRSVREILNYEVETEAETADKRVGPVTDMVMDDCNWVLRYFAVDIGGWLPERAIILSPAWIKKVSWSDRKIYIELTKKTIKNSPPYDPSQPVNRAYEEILCDYYGRPKYWEEPG